MTKKGFKFKPVTQNELIVANYASTLMGNKNLNRLLDIGASHHVTNNAANLVFSLYKVPNDIVVGDRFGVS